MSGLSVTEKLRTLAVQDATLQSFFGVDSATTVMRWFDVQIQPKALQTGLVIQTQQISESPRPYSHTSALTFTAPLVQFTVRGWPGKVAGVQVVANAPHQVRQARAAVIAWLGRVCFSASNQFDSPATTPPNYPNFVLNSRETIDPQLDPPAWTAQFDARIFNLDN